MTDLPGYGIRTDPEDFEDRPCERCGVTMPFDLNGARKVAICEECRSDIRADGADARAAQIERNIVRGA